MVCGEVGSSRLHHSCYIGLVWRFVVDVIVYFHMLAHTKGAEYSGGDGGKNVSCGIKMKRGKIIIRS